MISNTVIKQCQQLKASALTAAWLLLSWSTVFNLVLATEDNAELSVNPVYTKPPGQIVEVKGRRMHINCLGNKSPTIILDSGAGGFSLEWADIQRALSPYARICAYDRAGYGWSDMGQLPRTTKAIASELHALLQNAGIHRPYIFVGHSFGGYTAQYFARHFYGEIVGMVLIDSSHEEQVYRLPDKDNAIVRNSLHQDRRLMQMKPIINERFPEQQVAAARILMAQWTALMTWREEMASYALSAYQLRDIHASIPMLDMPLIVLTRGQRVWPRDAYGDTMEKIWMDLQSELVSLSSDATHIVADNSGHLIHLDEPALVIDAIHDILEAVERRRINKEG